MTQRTLARELRTLGDHVRKRRLDLGLTQKEVACRLGVDAMTVNNWETGRREPGPGIRSKLRAFLGRDLPVQGSDLGAHETPGSRLRRRRLELGLCQKELAGALGVSPDVPGGWEDGRHRPGRNLRARLAVALGEDFWDESPSPAR